jgi:hypothetical protein
LTFKQLKRTFWKKDIIMSGEITLILLICSQINGVCIIETPHQAPHFVPPFETLQECTEEGANSKKVFTKKYGIQGIPVDIKYRCKRWGTPV